MNYPAQFVGDPSRDEHLTPLRKTIGKVTVTDGWFTAKFKSDVEIDATI